MTSVIRKRETSKEPMSVADEAKVIRSIAKARTSLVLEHAFIGNIALNLPMKLDYDIPTAATNGKEIRYNPNFIEGLSDEERKFLIAHECFHPMLDHPTRRHGRDMRKFNKAGDYVINKLLTDERFSRYNKDSFFSYSSAKADL